MEAENSTEYYWNTTTNPEEVEDVVEKLVPLDTFIGLGLAFTSCFFIGISVIYKKLALREIEAKGGTRAVDGGYGYLRIPKWWLGISLMALGEVTNFVAYIFAPAILVTPLGVFSIVCTATLSPYFLKERLGTLGKLGCVLVLVGCIIVTLCGPKDREVTSMEELQSQLLHPGFLVYAALVVAVSAVFMALVPRYGHRYVLLYITICSSFGSLSVMFCKGVGLALKQTVGGTNAFTNWATWVCLFALVACLLIETVYMQRALDHFNSSVFMSINYVLFTSLVIIASSILYTELREIGVKSIILTLLGFVVNIVALFLLHKDKETVGVEAVPTPHPAEDENDNVPTSLQITKVPLEGLEQHTPLLSHAPASPLANLNLPHTMFPTKTNSCMSLISQTSLPHHAAPSSPAPDHPSDQERHLSTRSSSRDSGLSKASKQQQDQLHTPREAACPGQTSSTCICELPLLNELQTSSSSRFPPTSHSSPPKPGSNNNGSRRNSSTSNNLNNNSRNSSPSTQQQEGEDNALMDGEHIENFSCEAHQVLV